MYRVCIQLFVGFLDPKRHLFDLRIRSIALRFHHFVDSFDFKSQTSTLLLILLLISLHRYLSHLQLLLCIFQYSLSLPVVRFKRVIILPLLIKHLHPLEFLLLQSNNLWFKPVRFSLEFFDLLKILVNFWIFTFNIYFSIYELRMDLFYLLFFTLNFVLKRRSNFDVLLNDALNLVRGQLGLIQNSLVYRYL